MVTTSTKRCHLDLKDAQATFQRVMDNILTGIQGSRTSCYKDGVIWFDSFLEDHIKNLTRVFERLRKAYLKLQPDKYEFFKKEVAYLGHILTEEGVKPNPERGRAVQNFPEPETTNEIKSFLG